MKNAAAKVIKAVRRQALALPLNKPATPAAASATVEVTSRFPPENAGEPETAISVETPRCLGIELSIFIWNLFGRTKDLILDGLLGVPNCTLAKGFD